MLPDRQFSESMKYLARPIIVIPCPSGELHVYTAYAGAREFIAAIPPEELGKLLADRFEQHKAEYAARHRRATHEPAPTFNFDQLERELNLDLDNFSI